MLRRELAGWLDAKGRRCVERDPDVGPWLDNRVLVIGVAPARGKPLLPQALADRRCRRCSVGLRIPTNLSTAVHEVDE